MAHVFGRVSGGRWQRCRMRSATGAHGRAREGRPARWAARNRKRPPTTSTRRHLVSDTTDDGGSLAVISAGAAALARAADLDTALAVIVEAGAAAVGAEVAAVFGQDADREAVELLLTLGMAEAAVAAVAGGGGPEGAAWTGGALPLVVSAGSGVEDCVGVVTFGWPGEHEVDTAEETLL